MAECSSSFLAPASEKEEDTKVLSGCIAKGVWETITSSEQCNKIESMELKELKAYLNLSFYSEGWLHKEPSPPKKKLKLSLHSKKPRLAAPVTSEILCEAAKGVVPNNTKINNAWAVKTFTICREERNKRIPENPVPEDLLSCHDSISIFAALLHTLNINRQLFSLINTAMLFFPPQCFIFPIREIRALWL